jgi:hypothetical protein
LVRRMVERSDTHHPTARQKIDGYRFAPLIEG